MTTETKARKKNLSADFADFADLVFKTQVRTVFFNLRNLRNLRTNLGLYRFFVCTAFIN